MCILEFLQFFGMIRSHSVSIIVTFIARHDFEQLRAHVIHGDHVGVFHCFGTSGRYSVYICTTDIKGHQLFNTPQLRHGVAS